MAGTKQEQLDRLVTEITTLWTDADEQQVTADTKRIKLGRMLLDAKKLVRQLRFEWEPWLKAHFNNRSVRDANKCIELVDGRSDDEALAALCLYREKAKLGMRKTRAKRKKAKGTDGANVSPGDADTPPDAQPASSTTETLTEELSPVEKIKTEVMALEEEELREFCYWLKTYEAERFPEENGEEPAPAERTAADAEPVPAGAAP